MKEFDKKAATWDDDPQKVERGLKIAKALKQYFKGKSFAKGLDYGSGTGLLGFELTKMIKELTLMDQSSEMIKIAAAKANDHRFSKVTALQYDLLTDPLPEEKYDFIVTLLTMHHIEDTEAILKKFNAILNEDGILALIDLEKEDGSFHDFDFNGHLGFEKDVLEDQLQKNHFQVFDYFVIYRIDKARPDGSKRDYPLFLSLSKKS
jgi:predicted TPR repeat methyltransferase